MNDERDEEEGWEPTMKLRVRTSWGEADYLEQEWRRSVKDRYGAFVFFDTEWRRVPKFPEE